MENANALYFIYRPNTDGGFMGTADACAEWYLDRAGYNLMLEAKPLDRPDYRQRWCLVEKPKWGANLLMHFITADTEAAAKAGARAYVLEKILIPGYSVDPGFTMCLAHLALPRLLSPALAMHFYLHAHEESHDEDVMQRWVLKTMHTPHRLHRMVDALVNPPFEAITIDVAERLHQQINELYPDHVTDAIEVGGLKIPVHNDHG